MILKGDTILAFLLFFICALGVVKNTFESNMDMRVHIFYICLWIDYIWNVRKDWHSQEFFTTIKKFLGDFELFIVKLIYFYVIFGHFLWFEFLPQKCIFYVIC